MIPEKRLFISLPMADKTDEEILEKRNQIILEVRDKFGTSAYIEVIDNFFQNCPHEARPLWFLAKSLEFLSTADIVYFADGWDQYRGCKIEHECAVQYGIEIIHD
jgi:hypothetical protein